MRCAQSTVNTLTTAMEFVVVDNEVRPLWCQRFSISVLYSEGGGSIPLRGSMSEKWKTIYCHKCKEKIYDTPHKSHHYDIMGRDVIQVKAWYHSIDYFIPLLPDHKGHEWDLWYHKGCYDGDLPPEFPKVIDLFDNPHKK